MAVTDEVERHFWLALTLMKHDEIGEEAPMLS
jgi:hypothetical protein